MARKTGSVGAETARDVRDAALHLFARQGYAAVSMRQIAGEVGVQASALYNYFLTKQDLLANLMTAHMQALIAEWENQHREFADPAAALEGFGPVSHPLSRGARRRGFHFLHGIAQSGRSEFPHC
ncbi:MAG: helix-turn-helix domain-containing protein [Nitratireductor sp.]